MAAIIFGLLFCSLIALLGRNREIGYGTSFLLCFLLTPLIGVIIILCSKKKEVEFIEEKES